jgi:hypothetical protein
MAIARGQQALAMAEESQAKLSMTLDEELVKRLQTISGDLLKSYERRHLDVLTAIEDARDLLRKDDGRLGKWEAVELSNAETAVASDYLRLAVCCAMKAIDVSRLPAAEYEAGFNYSGGRQSSAWMTPPIAPAYSDLTETT